MGQKTAINRYINLFLKRRALRVIRTINAGPQMLFLVGIEVVVVFAWSEVVFPPAVRDDHVVFTNLIEVTVSFVFSLVFVMLSVAFSGMVVWAIVSFEVAFSGVTTGLQNVTLTILTLLGNQKPVKFSVALM